MLPFSDHNFLKFTLDNPRGVEYQSSHTLADGSTVDILDSGILQITPPNPTAMDVVISSGIHGNETAPIELVQGLSEKLLTGQLSSKVRLLLIIGNPVASLLDKRFEQVNMNRLFSGAHQQYNCWEADRASQLEQVISEFFQKGQTNSQRFHYDLHTAIRGSVHEKFAVHPYTDGAAYHQQQLGFLAASGIEAVLLSNKPTTTFSYYSYAQHQAQAFTLELGRVKPFGENDLTRFEKINQSLQKLIGTAELPQQSWKSSLHCFEVAHELNKDAEDFQFTMDDNVENFTTFNQGHLISTSSGQDYRVSAAREAIVFPNANIPVGQRAALMLCPIEAELIDTI